MQTSLEDYFSNRENVVKRQKVNSEPPVSDVESPKAPTAQTPRSQLYPFSLPRSIHYRERVGNTSTVAVLHRLRRFALTKYDPVPISFDIPNDPQSSITTLEFDREGVVLASGTSTGVLLLYDFDEFMYQSKLLNNNSLLEKDTSMKHTRSLLPIQSVYVKHQVQQIRWNPTNQDQIAITFTYNSSIAVFDLAKWSSRPTKVLQARGRPTTGNLDLVFVQEWQTPKSPKCRHVLAGDSDGFLRFWDLSSPKQPIWTVGRHQSGAINSIFLKDNQFAYCGTELGTIVCWNIRNLITPAFGSRAVPQRVSTWKVYDLIKCDVPEIDPRSCAVNNIKCHPKEPNLLVCQLKNEWVIAIDIVKFRLQKLHSVIRGIQRNQSEELVEVQAPEIVAPIFPTHLKHKKCIGKFGFNASAFCTGSTETQDLYIIDLHKKGKLPKSYSIKTNSGNPMLRTFIREVKYEGHLLVLSERLCSWACEVLEKSKKVRIGESLYDVQAIENRGLHLLLHPGLDIKDDIPVSSLEIYIQGLSCGNSRIAKDRVERLERYRIPTPQFVTAVETHPAMDFVICGMLGNEIAVVGPGR